MVFISANINYEGDVYGILSKDEFERKLFKTAGLVMFNASSEEECISAISNEFKNNGLRGKVLEHKFIKDLMDRFKNYHSPISKHIYSGIGIKLQNKDSVIMNNIYFSTCEPLIERFFAFIKHFIPFMIPF